jgi:hypothetical protein
MGEGPVDNPAHAFRQNQGTAAVTWLSTGIKKLMKDFGNPLITSLSPKLPLFPGQG